MNEHAANAARPATLAGINPHTVDMMRHALGYTSDLTKPGGYRNHYVPGTGSECIAEWEGLCALGLAERGRVPRPGEDAVYRVTDAGKALIEADHASRREAHGIRAFTVHHIDAPDDPWIVLAKSAGAARMDAARGMEECGYTVREALLSLRVRVAEPRRRVSA